MTKEFDQFYHENALYALKLACKYVPRVKAEDIVQNVFFEVWKRWDGIKKKGEYLRNSVKNRCFDEIKRISTMPFDEEMEIEDIKEIGINEHNMDIVVSYLDYLKPDYRTIIEYTIYGYSPAEICKITGWPLQTVKNKKSIAIAELKKIIYAYPG
jgi:RNA polymerase sigma factor (sigma-70 family)